RGRSERHANTDLARALGDRVSHDSVDAQSCERERHQREHAEQRHLEAPFAHRGERRFQMTLLSVFALVALALAALGIYGVMAYSVAQRSREIGIRMALGAAPRRVLGMVVAGGLRLAAAGVGLGIIGALAATRVLSALVYGVSTTDPLTLASTAAVLIVSAALASWIPARRATRLDPTLSLRAE